MNMNAQWVVEPLFSKLMDDVRNEAHQDHEPNYRHKAWKCIPVPGMPNQKTRVTGLAQITALPLIHVTLKATLHCSRPSGRPDTALNVSQHLNPATWRCASALDLRDVLMAPPSVSSRHRCFSIGAQYLASPCSGLHSASDQTISKTCDRSL